MKSAVFSRTSRSLLTCLAVAALAGCYTRLDDKPITSISASIGAPSGLGPGQSTQLTIAARTSDGKQLTTVGSGKGDVAFSSFALSGELVSVSDRGILTLVDDPRLIEGNTPHLHIATVGHPDVVADLTIPVRYDVAYRANFGGAQGLDGRPGRDGERGTNGTDGSDPNNPRPGGDGSPGGNGGRGGDGQDGDPGQATQVWLTVRPGDHPMLEARVLSYAQEKFYLIDPKGGSLLVDVSGGAGGRAGDGGFGGIGGKGGDGSPGGRYGPDGERGRPGRPGRGGAPGSITVWVDPAAVPYLGTLQTSVWSGDGVPGPDPQIVTAPVPLLW